MSSSDSSFSIKSAISSFMMNHGTHIVAILVGVSVTLLFGGILSIFSPPSTDTTMKTKEYPSNGHTTGNQNDNQKKSKKKNKKNKKTMNNTYSKNETPDNTSKNHKEKVLSTAGAEGAATATTTTKSTSFSGDLKRENDTSETKVKKNKKNKNKNKASQDTTTMNQANRSQDQSQRSQPEQPTREDENEEQAWNTITDSKKKKKKRGNTVATAATTTSTTTTTMPTTTPIKATAVVTIDASKVGIIIGPKGTTLQSIQAIAGCKLDVQAPSKDEAVATKQKQQKATIFISEPTNDDSINKAKKIIQDLATKGYSALLESNQKDDTGSNGSSSNNFYEQSVTLHPKYLSEIVGPQGKTIQAIQNTLQVKVAIPQTDWNPRHDQQQQQQQQQTTTYTKSTPTITCRVKIGGTNKANVIQARQIIQSIMKYHHHPITHPNIIHEEIYVPREFFHIIIGVKGSEIKHIRGNYKVNVYMPSQQQQQQQRGQSEEVEENVLVVGQQIDVEKAISYIRLLMDRYTEQRDQKYNDEYYG